jgi:hypothetical protein
MAPVTNTRFANAIQHPNDGSNKDIITQGIKEGILLKAPPREYGFTWVDFVFNVGAVDALLAVLDYFASPVTGLSELQQKFFATYKGVLYDFPKKIAKQGKLPEDLNEEDFIAKAKLIFARCDERTQETMREEIKALPVENPLKAKLSEAYKVPEEKSVAVAVQPVEVVVAKPPKVEEKSPIQACQELAAQLRSWEDVKKLMEQFGGASNFATILKQPDFDSAAYQTVVNVIDPNA